MYLDRAVTSSGTKRRQSITILSHRTHFAYQARNVLSYQNVSVALDGSFICDKCVDVERKNYE